VIGRRFPFLSEAAGRLGSVQVRNRATIGGNLCNASPSAEMAPSLICLRASAEILEEKGMKVIPLEDFFVGPGETAVHGVGLMRKILIPLLPQNSAGWYFKHSPRRTMDLAVVSVGCVLHLDRDKKKCVDSRIVLGAVAPTPLRAKKSEAVLNGGEITEREIEKAGETASQEAVPITDVRGSAEYRTEMVKVFVKQSIREALKMIQP
jgi:carbon-monoxide dehydrogenase medium subunit